MSMIECPDCGNYLWNKEMLMDKKHYQCACGCVFDKNRDILVEGMKLLNDDFEVDTIVFHGTTKDNAMKILKEGFKPYTFFARNLYNSLDWYGEYVFAVKMKTNPANLNWELRNKKTIKPNKILWLRKFTKDIIYLKK